MEDSNDLLKLATEYKEKGDYNKAIDILKEAYVSISKTNIEYPIETYLRLPLYLQIAKRLDEAIIAFNELLSSTAFNMYHSIIYDKMRLFYQRENQSEKAIKFGIFSFLKWAEGLNEQDRKQELKYHLSQSNIKETIIKLLKKAKLDYLEKELLKVIKDHIENISEINYSSLSDEIDKLLLQ
jgi:tetratricopeptide (TPR) repeat protein